MKKRQEYHAALSAEYALGTLRGAARRRFEEEMHSNPKLAAEVARWQETFAQLDDTLAPVIPPESVWKGIQSQLPPDIALTNIKNTNTVRRFPKSAYLGWAVAACLALFLLVPYLQIKPPPMTPVAILSTHQPTNASSETMPEGQWVVSINSNAQSLVLTPINMPDITKEQNLELWAIAADAKPRSLGLLDTQVATQLPLTNGLLASGSAATLAISLEPKGGSPTSQPTGPVLYSGAINL